jgi:hypothetical protein
VRPLLGRDLVQSPSCNRPPLLGFCAPPIRLGERISVGTGGASAIRTLGTSILATGAIALVAPGRRSGPNSNRARWFSERLARRALGHNFEMILGLFRISKSGYEILDKK